MIAPPSLFVFRVTVRGRFADLTDEARRYLVREQAQHEIFKSAYTEEGTFTYDARIAFFNLRYELRVSGDRLHDQAAAQGLREATAFLATMRFGFKALRVEVVDMSTMWPVPGGTTVSEALYGLQEL